MTTLGGHWDVSESAEDPLDPAMLLRAVVELQPLAVAVLQPVDGGTDFRFIYSNPALEEPHKGLNGRLVGEVWPQATERLQSIARRVLETGRAWTERDVPLLGRKDDRARVEYHDVEAAPLTVDEQHLVLVVVRETMDETVGDRAERVGDGVGDGIPVLSSDVSRRGEAGGRLRESEERFRSATSIPSLGLAETDTQLRYTWIQNDQNAGRCPSLIGRRLDEVYPSDDARRLVELERHALETDAPVQAQWSVETPRGRRWYDLYIQPRRDRQGNTVGLMSTAIDVTRHREVEDELAFSKRLLEAHIENSPLAIVEFDPALRIIRWSNEAERLFGWTAEEVVGKSISELDWVYEDDVELVARESAGLLDGSRARSMNLNRNLRKDGRVLWCEWYSSAIYDEEGALKSVLSFVVDVTERQLTARLRESSLGIDQVLHSSLDPDDIMQLAVSAGIEALDADASSLCVMSGGRLVVAYASGWRDDRVGMEIEGVGEGDLQAIQERGPVQIHAASARSPLVARHLEAWGTQSLISLPLVVRGTAAGVLYVCYTRRPHQFTQAELAFAERFASSLSLALENARLYMAEHTIAQTLQQSLVVLPSRIPGIVFGRYYEAATREPGQVGGDFVDVFEVRDHLVAMALGDVSGKGLDAAVTTSLIRNSLRAHALDALPPARVVAKANQVLLRFTPEASFVTLFFAMLDTRTGLLRYVCAGHQVGLVVSPDAVCELPPSRGDVLGVFERPTLTQGRHMLAQGDRLVIYSDGLSDARSPNGLFLGTDGIVRCLEEHTNESPDGICAALQSVVGTFSDGVLSDDVAVLVVEPSALRQHSQTKLDALL